MSAVQKTDEAKWLPGQNAADQEPDGTSNSAVVGIGFGAPKKKRVPCSQMDLSQRLEYACECMGFVKQSAHTYTSIDFCLDEIGKIDWVCHFVGLKELTIVNNSVIEIEGIDKCRFLEKVWLCNNSIEVIRCFEQLTNLRQLYLSSNKIRRIRGLDTLIGLQKLWLDGNLIEHVGGLTNLSNLGELNLASNLIETIGIGLDSLQNLKELNLAGNRIGSFKEVLNLNRLSLLESCNFSDPNYGENPICNLCNYQTYVLFHLPNLIRMDMKVISEDDKQFAESTFMKKRMYYNMRIKTIQRNTTNIIRLLKICRMIRKKKLDLQIDKFTRKFQEIQREIDERSHILVEEKNKFQNVCTYGPNNEASNPLDLIEDEQFNNDMEQKKAVVGAHLQNRDEDLKVLEQLYETTKKKIYEISEQNINRLITELDTGGNIRFEEGNAQDKWYTSCVDLVRSRFNSEQLAHLNICGIAVTRVTRIHNRYLRNKFEDKLEQLVDLTDLSYRRNLEYLFYGVNPQAPREMHKAMEEGFRSNQEYEDGGLPACVTLVNSVASAEIPRLNHYFKINADGRSPTKTKKDKVKPGQEIPVPSGQILVCKIFLQKCIQDPRTPYFNNFHTPSEIWRQSPLDPRNFPGVQSVYRVKENDQKQRMYIVMDHGLSLPEYLIDFDFCTTQASAIECKRLTEISLLNEECNQLFQGAVKAQSILESKGNQSQTDNRQVVVPLTYQDLDRSDMNCLKRLLHSFMTTCHIKELMDNNYQFLDEDTSAVLENAISPEIPLRSQFSQISEHLIVNISRKSDLSKIVYLNLFNNCIRKIQCIEVLVNLQTLILSFNQIEEIEGLSQNKNIIRLDINHNFIRNFKGLENQTILGTLDIRHNWIQDISQVEQLAKFCPNLKFLSLKSNPISNRRTYRSSVFNCWCLADKVDSSLQKLDGSILKDNDKNENGSQKELSSELIVNAVKHLKKKNIFIHESSNDQPTLVSEWEQQIEQLDLSHLKISTIKLLHSFVSLRKLMLLDNKIAVISGLENLKSLEELNLEKNKIQIIQNIESLKNLKKLDLGSNQIKRIQNLSSLQQLTQLSLENNSISRLDGLEDLQSLMELYIDNNLISEIQEILKLKDLPRLIILDCSCNPIANSQSIQNYRIFCIFNLRKLRVLDGISIDPQEHLEAKETFSGRLTEEILNVRLQGRKMNELRDLDLSNCKLKDFEDMFDNQKLTNIRELNLNGNMMSSLKAVGYLPTLKILRLRGNRIETLYCKPPQNEEKSFRRGLFGVLNLEFLDVTGNLLQYLYGLQTQPLKDLKVLLAADNQIAKIENLEKLKNLRELDLSKNRIKQFEPKAFYSPSQLTNLRLDDNTIKQIYNIEYLERLQVFSMASTRLSEFMELERIAELPSLIELNLLQTPLSRKPQYRLAVLKRLPQLEILDGKEIPQEEKRRIELAAGGIINPIQQTAPNIHFSAYPIAQLQQKQQTTVKVSNVNFEGIPSSLTPHQGSKNLVEFGLQVQGQLPPTNLNNFGSENMIDGGKAYKRPSTKNTNNEMMRSQQQNKYLQERPSDSLYQPSQFSQFSGPQAGSYLQGLQIQQNTQFPQQSQITIPPSVASANLTNKGNQQPRVRQAASQPQGASNLLQPPILQMQIQSLQSQQVGRQLGPGLPLAKR